MPASLLGYPPSVLKQLNYLDWKENLGRKQLGRFCHFEPLIQFQFYLMIYSFVHYKDRRLKGREGQITILSAALSAGPLVNDRSVSRPVIGQGWVILISHWLITWTGLSLFMASNCRQVVGLLRDNKSSLLVLGQCGFSSTKD